MRLLILDHLQPMLDAAERRIMIRKARRIVGLDPPRRGERRECVDRRGNAQRRIAAAIDQLMHLREKFDLANAAAPTLQVEAGAECLTLREMVADPVAHRADFLELAKIEAAAPDERLDRRQKLLAQRAVARRCARTDKRRLLPRERFGFIIGDRRIHRQDDRRHLGMRTQAQVDAEHMAVAGARRQYFGHPPRDPHRRLARIVALAARERVGVEDQYRVDVRRIVELVAAELAQRDDRKPARLPHRAPARQTPRRARHRMPDRQSSTTAAWWSRHHARPTGRPARTARRAGRAIGEACA
jgi:hypothetical protein